jgi:hypothetical protein
MNRTTADRHGAFETAPTIACFCALLFLAGFSGVLASETALESANAILNLEDV